MRARSAHTKLLLAVRLLRESRKLGATHDFNRRQYCRVAHVDDMATFALQGIVFRDPGATEAP